MSEDKKKQPLQQRLSPKNATKKSSQARNRRPTLPVKRQGITGRAEDSPAAHQKRAPIEKELLHHEESLVADSGVPPTSARPRVHQRRITNKVPVDPKPADELAECIAEAGRDKKATDVVIIDVQDKVDYTDKVVVMSGSSDRQVAALAKHIESEIEGRGLGKCLATEGLPHGVWVLMDFGDVIVHIFHQQTRAYYDLESMWQQAERFAAKSR